MTRPGMIAVAVAALALAVLTLGQAGAAANAPATTPLVIQHGDLARDCVGETMLNRAHERRIDFVVWCSVQKGEARFNLRRAEEPWVKEAGPIRGFAARPVATGPGAGEPFHCRRVGQGSVRCKGRKSGPLVVRGWIAVPAGTRCTGGVSLRAAEGIRIGAPSGCPQTPSWEPTFHLGSIRRQRQEMALDADLHGDRAAIDRRIRELIRAWKRGEPVARVSVSQLGMPMRAVDQEKWEFDEALLETTIDRLEGWLSRNDLWRAYAGYDVTDDIADGGKRIIYVGFTGDQNATLAAFKREVKLLAPDQVRPFPVQPLYSERYLWDLGEQLFDEGRSPVSRLIHSISVAVLENKVEVGTEHVAKVRRLLAQRFGPEAPFLVVFEHPAVIY